MPYTTIIAGNPIQASWANANVRDQVVTPFGTPGARDAAITSPVNGMVAALTTNTVAEGLSMRNSAGKWALPWNMPWGRLGIGYTDTNTVLLSNAGGEQVCLTTSAITTVANRRLVVIARAHASSGGTTITVTWRIRRGTSPAGVSLGTHTDVSSATLLLQSPLMIAEDVGAVGATQWVLTATPTSNFDVRNPVFWSVEDVGPFGAPA